MSTVDRQVMTQVSGAVVHGAGALLAAAFGRCCALSDGLWSR